MTPLAEAAKLLREADELVAVCHVGPDGDALGSLLGAGLALRAMGKKVTLGWGSQDMKIPDQYTFLPALDTVTPPSAWPADAPLALVLDCASADRLELLQERVLACPVVINVDHHVSNPGFGTLDVIDPDSPATAELVYRLLDEMDVDIGLDVATCLYTGLVTDTGRFGYASVDRRAHEAAGALLELGVRPDVVSQAVYESLPYGYLKLLGAVLERATLDEQLVVSWMTREDLARTSVGIEETESVIDDLRKIREADVACVLKQQPDGRWKGSLRSKGATDVGRVAQRLGGGGHKLAAGFTLGSADLQGCLDLVRATLAEGSWATD